MGVWGWVECQNSNQGMLIPFVLLLLITITIIVVVKVDGWRSCIVQLTHASKLYISKYKSHVLFFFSFNCHFVCQVFISCV